MVVVTGAEHDEVEALLPPGAERAVQAERLGSGDAVRAGMAPLADFEGDVMVLNGDVPLAGGDLFAAPAPSPRRLHRPGDHHHRGARPTRSTTGRSCATATAT